MPESEMQEWIVQWIYRGTGEEGSRKAFPTLDEAEAWYEREKNRVQPAAWESWRLELRHCAWTVVQATGFNAPEPDGEADRG